MQRRRFRGWLGPVIVGVSAAVVSHFTAGVFNGLYPLIPVVIVWIYAETLKHREYKEFKKELDKLMTDTVK